MQLTHMKPSGFERFRLSLVPRLLGCLGWAVGLGREFCPASNVLRLDGLLLPPTAELVLARQLANPCRTG
jgi:hypothetical protein